MSKRSGKQYSTKIKESVSSMESEVSGEQSPTPVTDASSLTDKAQTESSSTHVNGGIGRATPVNLAKTSHADIQSEELTPVNASNSKSASPSTDRGHPERKRRASEDSMEEATRSSETGTNDDLSGLKDEDDEDDNDDEEKIPPGHHYDPERLKAFNMFVRLFVDENLDRMVPISKQPKDKIQAILEACDRQFPEFHERSRKRIRTYLKSCRRMRRSKEQNGWEPLRPTPPHLTSAAAESLLAQACENEGQNAKRMRMGLEPLAASAMNTMNPLSVVPTTSQPQKPTMAPSPPPSSQPATAQQTQNNSAPSIDRHTPASTDFLRTQAPPPAFRPPPEFHAPFFPNGNGLFRPGFPPGYQHPAHHHPPVLQHSPIQPATVQNGPTDLSMKKNSSKNQLSTSEVATIKQLIAGYRESAAFLYRSADELEQLLLQQS